MAAESGADEGENMNANLAAESAITRAIRENGPCSMAQATYLSKAAALFHLPHTTPSIDEDSARRLFQSMVRAGVLVPSGYSAGHEVYACA